MISKTLLVTLVFYSIFIPSSFGQEELVEPVLNYMEKKAAEKIESYLAESDSTYAEEQEGEEWDDVLRTSEMDDDFERYGERQIPEGLRIGSICMDGTPSDDRGRGACAGYGGVRYWLYQKEDSSIVQVPTRRHLEHPEVLNEIELANLSSRNEATQNTLFQAEKVQPGNSSGGSFYNMISVIMICLTVAYIAKLYFQHSESV